MNEHGHGDGLNDLLEGLRSGGQGWPRGAVAHDHDPGVSRTVRSLVEGGHEIRIETTYRITVDGTPLPGHVEVLDNGRVHYHGLPNYAVASTVDLMRLVVDHFGTAPPAEDELGDGGTQ